LRVERQYLRRYLLPKEGSTGKEVEDYLGVKNEAIEAKNAYFWDINLE